MTRVRKAGRVEHASRAWGYMRAMDYKAAFRSAVDQVRSEGRYRVFADLKRRRGEFPRATFTGPAGEREVVVWCSNDYLGQGQNPVVLDAMHKAIDEAGSGSAARATFPARPITMSSLRPSWPISMAGKRLFCSPRAMSPTRRRWRPCSVSCLG